MKIMELRGLKSVRIYQLYQQALIVMACARTTRAKSIESFMTDFENNENMDEKRNILRTAAMSLPLDGDDIKNVLDFVIAENGVEYSQQIGAMTPDKIIDAVTEVLLKCSDMRVFFWTPQNQKKSKIGQSV